MATYPPPKIPLSNLIVEIPTQGPRTKNIVVMSVVADAATFIAWARGLRWEATLELIEMNLGVFVNLSRMSWVLRRECWLPVADGVRALCEMACHWKRGAHECGAEVAVRREAALRLRGATLVRIDRS